MPGKRPFRLVASGPVSTLAAAPERPGEQVPASSAPAGSPAPTTDAILGFGLAVALVVLAFPTVLALLPVVFPKRAVRILSATRLVIFSLLGAVVSERIGPLRALIIGIWLMAIGQIASGYAPNFAALLACRVLEGVGYGLVIAPPGTLVMQWFGEGEWPYINMVNFSFAYVGLTAVFRATPVLFAAVGSWRMTLLWFGVGSAGVALLWTIFGREHRIELTTPAPGAIEAPAERGSALMEVAKMRNVLLVAAGLFGGMWVFQI